MTGNKYQEKAHSFATKGGDTLLYALLGLIEETGELVEKVALRGNTDFAIQTRAILSDYARASKAFGLMAKDIRKNWDKMQAQDRDTCLNPRALKSGVGAEIGDICWNVANIAHHLGIKMDDILSQNIAKLRERKSKNVIIGNGDTTKERIANAGK